MVAHPRFRLADGRGPFVGSGLQDPTGRADTFLGNSFDTSVRWAPQEGYFRQRSFEVGYSHLFKGSYLKHRITNAVAEELNSKMATIQKRACGFRNRDHFKLAVYFHCGGLN